MSFNSNSSNNFTFPGHFRSNLTTKQQRMAIFRSLFSGARGSGLSFQALGLKFSQRIFLFKIPFLSPKTHCGLDSDLSNPNFIKFGAKLSKLWRFEILGGFECIYAYVVGWRYIRKYPFLVFFAPTVASIQKVDREHLYIPRRGILGRIMLTAAIVP